MGNLDLHAPGSHPVRIGDGRHGMTLVRYNHKPAVTEELATATIRRDTRKEGYTLTIEDGEDDFVYEAQQGDVQDTVVLLLDDEQDGLVLEMADASLSCNLIEAPWEQDAKKLAEQYTILRAEEGEHDTGDGADGQHTMAHDEQPDPANPFDFRNYVDNFTHAAANNTAKNNATAKHDTATSGVSTPRATSAAARSVVKKPTNPLVSAQRKKPRAAAGNHTPMTTTAKRRKSPPRAAAPLRSVPEVHIDNSDADGPDADDGLILDDAPAAPVRPHFKRGAPSSTAHLRAAVGAADGGPISLRSAASSPAASHSPAPSRRGGAHGYHHDEDDGDLLMDDHDDHAAPAVRSPSPPAPPVVAMGRRKSLANTSAALDEDDDFDDAEMLKLMEEEGEDDEGPAPARYVEEEEEESEEE